MGRKKTKDASAPDDRTVHIPIPQDIRTRDLERTLMQALAIGAYCFSHSPAMCRQILAQSLSQSGRPRTAGAQRQKIVSAEANRIPMGEWMLGALHDISWKTSSKHKLSDASSLTSRSSQTIEEGLKYEREIALYLEAWAKANGGSAEHVGTDNRPGDVVLAFPSRGPCREGLRMVVEVRSRRSRIGRKAVANVLAEAMAARSAEAAIYLSRTAEGLVHELGDWSEGDCSAGPFVACTHEHLTTAVCYLLASIEITRLRRASAEVDDTAIRNQISRVRTALEGLRKISRLGNEIRSATWEIDDESDRLRQEVRDALTLIEQAVHDPSKHGGSPRNET